MLSFEQLARHRKQLAEEDRVRASADQTETTPTVPPPARPTAAVNAKRFAHVKSRLFAAAAFSRTAPHATLAAALAAGPNAAPPGPEELATPVETGAANGVAEVPTSPPPRMPPALPPALASPISSPAASHGSLRSPAAAAHSRATSQAPHSPAPSIARAASHQSPAGHTRGASQSPALNRAGSSAMSPTSVSHARNASTLHARSPSVRGRTTTEKGNGAWGSSLAASVTSPSAKSPAASAAATSVPHVSVAHAPTASQLAKVTTKQRISRIEEEEAKRYNTTAQQRARVATQQSHQTKAQQAFLAAKEKAILADLEAKLHGDDVTSSRPRRDASPHKRTLTSPRPAHSSPHVAAASPSSHGHSSSIQTHGSLPVRGRDRPDRLGADVRTLSPRRQLLARIAARMDWNLQAASRLEAQLTDGAADADQQTAPRKTKRPITSPPLQRTVSVTTRQTTLVRAQPPMTQRALSSTLRGTSSARSTSPSKAAPSTADSAVDPERDLHLRRQMSAIAAEQAWLAAEAARLKINHAIHGESRLPPPTVLLSGSISPREIKHNGNGIAHTNGEPDTTSSSEAPVRGLARARSHSHASDTFTEYDSLGPGDFGAEHSASRVSRAQSVSHRGSTSTSGVANGGFSDDDTYDEFDGALSVESSVQSRSSQFRYGRYDGSDGDEGLDLYQERERDRDRLRDDLGAFYASGASPFLGATEHVEPLAAATPRPHPRAAHFATSPLQVLLVVEPDETWIEAPSSASSPVASPVSHSPVLNAEACPLEHAVIPSALSLSLAESPAESPVPSRSASCSPNHLEPPTFTLLPPRSPVASSGVLLSPFAHSPSPSSSLTRASSTESDGLARTTSLSSESSTPLARAPSSLLRSPGERRVRSTPRGVRFEDEDERRAREEAEAARGPSSPSPSLNSSNSVTPPTLSAPSSLSLLNERAEVDEEQPRLEPEVPSVDSTSIVVPNHARALFTHYPTHRVRISLSCQSLPSSRSPTSGQTSVSTIVEVSLKHQVDGDAPPVFVPIARTEFVPNSRNPVYSTVLEFEHTPHARQVLKFALYDLATYEADQPLPDSSRVGQVRLLLDHLVLPLDGNDGGAVRQQARTAEQMLLAGVGHERAYALQHESADRAAHIAGAHMSFLYLASSLEKDTTEHDHLVAPPGITCEPPTPPSPHHQSTQQEQEQEQEPALGDLADVSDLIDAALDSAQTEVSSPAGVQITELDLSSLLAEPLVAPLPPLDDVSTPRQTSDQIDPASDASNRSMEDDFVDDELADAPTLSPQHSLSLVSLLAPASPDPRGVGSTKVSFSLSPRLSPQVSLPTPFCGGHSPSSSVVSFDVDAEVAKLLMRQLETEDITIEETPAVIAPPAQPTARSSVPPPPLPPQHHQPHVATIRAQSVGALTSADPGTVETRTPFCEDALEAESCEPSALASASASFAISSASSQYTPSPESRSILRTINGPVREEHGETIAASATPETSRQRRGPPPLPIPISAHESSASDVDASSSYRFHLHDSRAFPELLASLNAGGASAGEVPPAPSSPPTPPLPEVKVTPPVSAPAPAPAPASPFRVVAPISSAPSTPAADISRRPSESDRRVSLAGVETTAQFLALPRVRALVEQGHIATKLSRGGLFGASTSPIVLQLVHSTPSSTPAWQAPLRAREWSIQWSSVGGTMGGAKKSLGLGVVQVYPGVRSFADARAAKKFAAQAEKCLTVVNDALPSASPGSHRPQLDVVCASWEQAAAIVDVLQTVARARN